jgi:DNA-binding CsgD family transcriptional regulator
MGGLSPQVMASLHAAALDAALWPDALAAVADAIGAGSAMVHAMAPDPRDSVMHVGRLDPDLTRLYLTQYQVNPMSDFLIRQRPGEVLQTMSRCGGAPALSRTAFHADILAPQRIGEITNLLYGDWRGTLTGGYAFCLHGSAAAENAAAHVAALRRVSPQLTLALDLARHFAGALRRNWTVLLETIAAPALLTDADGRIILANPGAEAMLRHGVWLRLRGGRLRAAAPRAQAALTGAIRDAALDPTAPRRSTRLAIPAAGGAPPCLAVIGSAPVIPVIEIGLPRPGAILILQDPGAAPDPATLRDMFGLTGAEARIAAHIAAGRTLGAASAREGIAHSTARTHLQAVFGKLGVRSQAALAGVLARLPSG